ncbi:MAG: rane protein, partial [Actinomycetia bacterium]|nr:rane protein [Actinomycetes bacterium]
RPWLWGELLLIGVGYWIYSLIRDTVPGRADVAFANAHTMLRIEGDLGIGVEQHLNHAVDGVSWLIVGMDYFYSVLWVIVTIGVLVWLYIRHAEYYRAVRWTLFTTTMLALVGFYFFPLAPPRLLPGFVDTVMAHHTWGSVASANVASLANQYAAMPSMHIGWSLWSGIAILRYAQQRWARVLALLYPLATLVAVVSTGNHYLLDAAGGALTLACGYALQHFLTTGTRVRHPAKRPIMASELGTDSPRAVLVGIDGSRTSLRAADFALGHAHRVGAELLCVYVRSPSSTFVSVTPGGPQVAEKAHDECLREVTEFITPRAADMGVTLRLIQTRGDVARELTRPADEAHADAVIVSASDSRGHRLAGSPAARLMRSTHWPVTVIP